MMTRGGGGWREAGGCWGLPWRSCLFLCWECDRSGLLEAADWERHAACTSNCAGDLDTECKTKVIIRRPKKNKNGTFSLLHNTSTEAASFGQSPRMPLTHHHARLHTGQTPPAKASKGTIEQKRSICGSVVVQARRFRGKRMGTRRGIAGHGLVKINTPHHTERK